MALHHLHPLRLIHRRRLLWRQLDASQHHRDALLKLVQHRVEQRKSLGLVFVQRIALAIGTQPDALAQRVQRIQVLSSPTSNGWRYAARAWASRPIAASRTVFGSRCVPAS